MITYSPHNNTPNSNIPNPIKGNEKEADTKTSMTPKSLDEVNNSIQSLSSKKFPPLPGQRFNDNIPLVTDKNNMPSDMPSPAYMMKKIPEGKFKLEEVHNLEKLYGKDGVKQSIDENGHIDKKKFSSFLAGISIPPMQLNSQENRKDLFNLNV